MSEQPSQPAAAANPNNTPAPAVRKCGGCTLCCKVLAIRPIDKPAGIVCKHVVSGGCGVQEERQVNPIYHECNSYNCLWLVGELPEADRPDKLRAVFTALRHPDPGVTKPMVAVNESHPGAADSGRARQLIDSFVRSGHHVVVKNRQYSTEIYPNGTAVRYRIDPADPMSIRYDATVKPIVLTVGGRQL